MRWALVWVLRRVATLWRWWACRRLARAEARVATLKASVGEAEKRLSAREGGAAVTVRVHNVDCRGVVETLEHSAAPPPARREPGRAERDLAQVRRCIDQNLATLREAAGEWPEGWLHQHAANAIAVSNDESLPDQVRFQALLQYVAIQVLEAERLELVLMGAG